MELQRLLYQSILWRGLFFAFQLLLNILIARIYEPAGSGWLFYTLNNYAFLLLLLSLSIDSGMGYYLASGKLSARKLSTLALAWTVLATGLALAWLYIADYDPTVYNNRDFILLSAGYIAGTMLVSFFSALYYAQKDFFTPNLILVGFTIALVLLLLMVNDEAGGWINSRQFLVIYILSFLLQGICLAGFFQLRARGPFDLPSRGEMRWLLRYSLLAFAGNLLTFLVFRVDYWMIHYFGRSADELGNYIQVSKLAQLFFTLPSVLATAVFPLTAGGAPSIGKELPVLSRLVVFFAAAGTLFLALAGYWLFPFVFGDKFSGMYRPFLCLVPGIIAICLAYPLAGYFSGKNRIGVNIGSSVLALVLIVAGNIIFIPLLGITGAAAVSSAGYLALCGYLLYHFKKDMPAELRSFFFLKKTDLDWLLGLFKNKSADGAGN